MSITSLNCRKLQTSNYTSSKPSVSIHQDIFNASELSLFSLQRSHHPLPPSVNPGFTRAIGQWHGLPNSPDIKSCHFWVCWLPTLSWLYEVAIILRPCSELYEDKGNSSGPLPSWLCDVTALACLNKHICCWHLDLAQQSTSCHLSSLRRK